MSQFRPTVLVLGLLCAFAQSNLLSSLNPLPLLFGSPYPSSVPGYPVGRAGYPVGALDGAMEPQNQEIPFRHTGWNESCWFDYDKVRHTCCAKEDNKEVREMCQRCWKVTKSKLVMPYCCNDHENSRQWCRELLAIG